MKDKGHPGVFLNEDLTKSRMDLLYKARGKVKGTFLLGAWSSDGVILVKDNEGRVHRITSEGDLIDFNTPRPVNVETMESLLLGFTTNGMALIFQLLTFHS